MPLKSYIAMPAQSLTLARMCYPPPLPRPSPPPQLHIDPQEMTRPILAAVLNAGEGQGSRSAC